MDLSRGVSQPERKVYDAEFQKNGRGGGVYTCRRLWFRRVAQLVRFTSYRLQIVVVAEVSLRRRFDGHEA